MHAEEGASRSRRLHFHERRPWPHVACIAELGRQLFHGSLAKERGERQRLPEPLLDVRHDLHGEQGVSSELEEVVFYTDGLDPEHLLPNLHEIELKDSAWRNECTAVKG